MQFAYAAFQSSYIHNLTEIANISQIKNVSTVTGDLAFLRLDAKKNIKNYIDEKIAFEHEKDIVALEGIKKRAGKYQTAQTKTNVNNTLTGLSLAKECIIT
jgi:hypothetical protein